MFRTLPLFYLKKSRRVSKIVYRNIVSITYSKQSFQNEVLKYFEEREDDSPGFNEEPLLKNGKIQMYRDEISKLHSMAKIRRGGNVKKELEEIFTIFNKLSSTVDPVIKQNFLDDLDYKCFSVVNYLQPSEILKLLNLFFKIIPNEFKASYFFDKALSNLVNFAENQLLSDHETIQLMWFISLNGQKYGNYMTNLEPCIPDMDMLPLMEKCILVQSFYNTSTKLTSSQIKEIIKTLERDFKKLIFKPDYLTILSKALILSETSINVSLKKLSEQILNLEEPIKFSTATYLLNSYALTRIYEEKVLVKLVKQSIERLKEDMIAKTFSIPLMDLEKFLWSISFLGIYLTLNEKSIIMPYMEQRYTEFITSKENLFYLLNSIVSSIMLRSWSTKLIRRSLEDRVFDPFFKNNSRIIMQPRVQLLLTLLSTEVKMLNFIPREFQKKINFNFIVSKKMNFVADVANDLVKKNVIRYVTIECPIHCIDIPGVTFSTAVETYHIDVLDNWTCFKETTLPHGLMNLKFRLLSRLGYRLIKIDGNIFKDEPKKIKSYIEKEIVKRINNGTERQMHENKTV